jgi:hypothetical protein
MRAQCLNFLEWYEKSHSSNERILTLATVWPSHLSHMWCWASLLRETSPEKNSPRERDFHIASATLRSWSSQSVQRSPHEILQHSKWRDRKIERDREQLSTSICKSAEGTEVEKTRACSCNAISESRVQLSQSNREIVEAEAYLCSELYWISEYSWDFKKSEFKWQHKHWHSLTWTKLHEENTRTTEGQDKELRAEASEHQRWSSA